MIVTISKSAEDGKWFGRIDDKEITKGQKWLWQCLFKMYKYAKSQDA